MVHDIRKNKGVDEALVKILYNHRHITADGGDEVNGVTSIDSRGSSNHSSIGTGSTRTGSRSRKFGSGGRSRIGMGTRTVTYRDSLA